MGRIRAKQQRFVDEYLIDLNATQAAIRAGYSAKTAQEQSSRLLSNVMVQTKLTEAIQARAERTHVDQDWVITVLVKNIEQALRAVPVRDKQGKPIGEYVYEGNVVNKAAELLGRHLTMFPTHVEVSGKYGQPLEVNFTIGKGYVPLEEFEDWELPEG